MRVLLIDDEPIYYKMLSKPLANAGYELEYAQSGTKGLAAIKAFNPDIVVTDLSIPDLDGFEIIKRLRRDSRLDHIPVIFVTVHDSLDIKLKAFEHGADDYLVKPFQPEELVARLGILARRGKAVKVAQELGSEHEAIATVVAVHSLRGGIGVSSLAVNLAIAFHQIWGRPTLLVDGVLAAGQVAMMLDTTPHGTWEDLLNAATHTADGDMINDICTPHPSGISFLASPKFPIAPDAFHTEFWHTAFERLIGANEFVVVDTAHDFSDLTISSLNIATEILLVLAPEMASLRSALAALNIYDQLGYMPDKIKVVLNHSIPAGGIKQSQIEKVLGRPVNYVLPHEPKEVFKAVNFGKPFALQYPELPVTVAIEDMAYQLSNYIHKNLPPAAPSAAWKRVTDRL